MLPILLETVILSSSCFHNLKKQPKKKKKITAETQTTNNRAKPNPTLPFCLLNCQLVSYIHTSILYMLLCSCTV